MVKINGPSACELTSTVVLHIPVKVVASTRVEISSVKGDASEIVIIIVADPDAVPEISS